MWTRYFIVLLAVTLVSSVTEDDKSTVLWITNLFKNKTNNDDDINLQPTSKTQASKESSEEEIDLTPNKATQIVTCKTIKGEEGECVPYYLCDPDTYTMIEDGTTIIDIRSARPCPSYLEVCCAHKRIEPNTFSISVPLTTTPLPPISNDKVEHLHGTPYLDLDFQHQEGDDSFLDLTPDKNDAPNVPQCGWDVPELFFFPPKDNILYANYGEFPWAVAITEQRESIWEVKDAFIGGGVLIHPAVVISVAHKFDKKLESKFKIRAGEWDTQTTKEMYPHQERDVRKIIIHPQYYRVSAYYDVALLVLSSPVELAGAPHVRPACLGARLPPAGTVCYGMGWGEDYSADWKYATTLKKIKLPLVGAQDCEEMMQRTRLGRFFTLHGSLTCAGGEEGIDTCAGDGGSSLVCPIATEGKRTRYAVYGLVAFGIGCGERSKPGVYANVPAVREWIDRTMSEQQFPTETYKA